MIDIVVLYCFIVFYIIWRATLIVDVALQHAIFHLYKFKIILFYLFDIYSLKYIRSI